MTQNAIAELHRNNETTLRLLARAVLDLADGAWKNACRAAGLPGRIPHDLRRSAIRNFVRAGLSETSP